MIEETGHLGLLVVRIFIAEARSLKQKRAVLRSLKDRVRVRFNVSSAEVDGHDKWQTAVLGFAMVSRDHRHLERTLQHLLAYVEAFPGLEVCEHCLDFF